MLIQKALINTAQSSTVPHSVTPTDKLRVSDTLMEIAGMRHISATFNMVSTLSTQVERSTSFHQKSYQLKMTAIKKQIPLYIKKKIQNNCTVGFRLQFNPNTRRFSIKKKVLLNEARWYTKQINECIRKLCQHIWKTICGQLLQINCHNCIVQSQWSQQIKVCHPLC